MSRLGSPTDNLSRDRSGSATDIGSQLTAENRSIEVGGDTLVYRRFGNTQTNAPPLLCLQHFRGNLDFWDPALVDRIAASCLPNGSRTPTSGSTRTRITVSSISTRSCSPTTSERS